MALGIKGKVALASQGFASVATFLRPNDTTTYGGGDVVGPSTANGSFALGTGDITNTFGPLEGGEVLLNSLSFEVDSTALISSEASYSIHFYTQAPAALGDNVAWDLSTATDRVTYQGFVTLGTPVDLGSTLYLELNGLQKQITVAPGGKTYCYLTTAGAYQPTALRVFAIKAHTLAL